MTDVIVAGSNNVTGHNVINALAGHCNILGYDYSDASTNPTNTTCHNVRVPPATDKAYADAIRKLLDEHKPELIIPSNDSDLRALVGMNDELVSRGIVLNGTGPHVLKFLDKEATTDLFQNHGITTPGLVGMIHDSPRPVVVRKRLVGNGKKFSRIVQEGFAGLTSEELRLGVITKYVEGEEYTIDVLCDFKSRPVSIVPRLRREVRYGMVHHGQVIQDFVVIEETLRLISKLKLTGISCIQCIKTVGGEAYFFEVNARPGSGLSLTTAAGVNMPELMLRIVRGEDVPTVSPEWGLNMVRYFEGYYYR